LGAPWAWAGGSFPCGRGPGSLSSRPTPSSRWPSSCPRGSWPPCPPPSGKAPRSFC